MQAEDFSRSMGAIMANELEPEVGQWYVHQDKGELFRVVAIDPTSASVEIQSFDGDIEEIDLEVWREMVLTAAQAPEDWTGPYDELPADDLEYSVSDAGPWDWRVSLELETPPDAWRDARATDEIE
jgi:hypothetical protein